MIDTEKYVREPMPLGVRVVVSPVEGPVYADASGRTLYQWPRKELRNGAVGDVKGAPSMCEDVKQSETSGLMSPYPAGLVLPDVATRMSCEQMWPPLLADAKARPVGRWTIINRKDGRGQWAYDGLVLYTSSLDSEPGQALGGTRAGYRSSDPVGYNLSFAPGAVGYDGPAARFPIGPPPDVPGQFVVEQTYLGRQLTLANGYSVYTWDGDGPDKSNCDRACLQSWTPVFAPEVVTQPREDWSVVERAPGVKQWAYRRQPVYSYIREHGASSQHGMDVPGWSIVFTQRAPPPPPEFTRQDSPAGVVLADSRGRTIYLYNCGDDALDQLACDHPDAPQEYRFAICGGGNADRCLQTFPYVIAAKGARGSNAAWSVMEIDPATGRRAVPGQGSALRVWAYRQRPVFTFARDPGPGAINAQNYGEFFGQRNGYKVFFLREEFRRR